MNIPTPDTEPQGTSATRKLHCASHLSEALGWGYLNYWSDTYKDFGLCQLSLSQWSPSTAKESGLQAAVLLSRTESTTRVGTSYSWPDTRSCWEQFQRAALVSTGVTRDLHKGHLKQCLQNRGSSKPWTWQKMSVVNTEGMKGPQISSPGRVMLFFSVPSCLAA